MENKFFLADYNDISKKKKLIEQKYSELLCLVKDYRQMIEDTKNIYDTESAKYFRNVALNYMDIVPIKFDSDFLVYVDSLDDIVSKYSEMYHDIQKMIDSQSK